MSEPREAMTIRRKSRLTRRLFRSSSLQDLAELGRVGRLELLDVPLHPFMQASQFGLKVGRQRALLAGRMGKGKDALGLRFHPVHVPGETLQDIRFPAGEAVVREVRHYAARLGLLALISLVMAPVPGDYVVLNSSGERIYPAFYSREVLRVVRQPANPAGGSRKGIGNVPQRQDRDGQHQQHADADEQHELSVDLHKRKLPLLKGAQTAGKAPVPGFNNSTELPFRPAVC